MPEGDTVYRHCRMLDDALAGATITRCELRVPSLATADLVGWTITGVHPRGKHLLVHLAAPQDEVPRRQPFTLHSHLMMEGRWHIATAPDPESLGPWEAPAHQVRILIEARHPDGHAVRAIAAEVQQVRLVPTRSEVDLVGHLGPDLLDPGWSDALRDEAVRNLLAEPDRTLGAALLDQRCLAGIGNVYRSEICFLRGHHPATAIAGLAPDTDALAQEMREIVDLSRRLLDVNRDRSHRVTTGGMMGPRGDLWVYGRAGQPCRRCRARIRREELGAPKAPAQQERVIYLCPRCQESAGAPGWRRPGR